MTPDTVSSIVSTLPQFSTGMPRELPQGEKTATTPSTVAAVVNDTKAPVDTVNISFQTQQTKSDVKKEAVSNQDAITVELNKVALSAAPDTTPAKVEFVYTQNGDLTTRYLDSADRLIYQTPSDLMLLMKEQASKSESSVDMKV